MFNAVPMLRLSAVVLGRDARAVLRALGRLGGVELTRTAAGDATAPLAPSDQSGDLARYDRLLARIAEICRALGLTAGSKANALPMTFDQAERELALWEGRVNAWTMRREQIQRRAAQCHGAHEQVRLFQDWAVPLGQVAQPSFLHFVTGTLPAGALEEIQLPAEVVVVRLPTREKGVQPLVALTTSQGRTALDERMRRSGFQPHLLPVVEGQTTKMFFAEGQREEATLAAELRKLDKEGQVLALAAAGPLAQLEQWAATERQLCEAEQLFPRTEASVLITGWVPADDVGVVQNELQGCTQGCCVMETTPPACLPEEQVPVLLRHSWWLRPFAMLVTAYGLPRYGELAPTLFVALSYLLMFGMMFGDVGHGGLLALAGAGLLAARRQGKTRDFGMLLLAGGIASACFGAAYGSCFGLPQFKHYAWWRDPLEGDPINLMLLAMGMGVGLMSVGLALNIINRLRSGNLADGLLDKFGLMGLVFYWGALALITRSAAIQAQGWWDGALVLLLAVPLACWIVKEPLALWWKRQAGHQVEPGRWCAVLTESGVGAFEGVLLYFANTVSFVRLAAYAMSHAALLMATFAVADQVRSLSGGRVVLAVLVIVLGNLVAIALEGVVAAVQALRLEYYEFFGKFFSGDGQPFKPFSLRPEPAG